MNFDRAATRLEFLQTPLCRDIRLDGAAPIPRRERFTTNEMRFAFSARGLSKKETKRRESSAAALPSSRRVKRVLREGTEGRGR